MTSRPAAASESLGFSIPQQLRSIAAERVSWQRSAQHRSAAMLASICVGARIAVCTVSARIATQPRIPTRRTVRTITATPPDRKPQLHWERSRSGRRDRRRPRSAQVGTHASSQAPALRRRESCPGADRSGRARGTASARRWRRSGLRSHARLRRLAPIDALEQLVVVDQGLVELVEAHAREVEGCLRDRRNVATIVTRHAPGERHPPRA